MISHRMYNCLDDICWEESNVILTDAFNTHINFLVLVLLVLLVLLRYMYNSDSNKNVKNQ